MKAVALFDQYRAVFKAAVQLESAKQANHRHYSDQEFLPAALEVMESPPSPLARGLLLALCGLFGIALLWSIVGKVDVVAVASGATRPEARVNVVQWSGGGGSEGMTGVVRAIHVREGDHVKAGQLLVELDPTMTGADKAQAERGLLAAQIDRARAQALSAYIAGGSPDLVLPEGVTAELAATQRALIRSTIAEYEARRSSLLEQRAGRQAEAAATRAQLESLQESLPLLEKQVAARAELADKGYGSKLLLWRNQEMLVERRGNIDVQRANLARNSAAVANIDQQLTQLKQELSRSSFQAQVQADDTASQRTQEITKADQRQKFTRIIAPISGSIHQLSVTTLGGVVEAAQPLLTIVPSGSPLIVEAQMPGKDIGFVRIGQPVDVKLEAYPFTRYGLIEGTLIDVSADSIAPASGVGSGNQAGAGAGALFYTVRVKLNPGSVRTFTQGLCGTQQAAGRCSAALLPPGLAAQAEIKTGRRRIISYLVSPISRAAQEAGREQ